MGCMSPQTEYNEKYVFACSSFFFVCFLILIPFYEDECRNIFINDFYAKENYAIFKD